jgi:hypothetical protein
MEKNIDKSHFYCLHDDRFTQFGGSGEAFLIYLLWIHKQLPPSDSHRKRILSVLYQLNEERRQDFHLPTSLYEDIVDRDLLSYRSLSTIIFN